MSSQPKRVLPADVYDFLELSALVYGGIGAGEYREYTEDEVVPMCVIGHATFASVQDAAGRWQSPAWEVRESLYVAGISECDNDRAVRRVNRAKGAELVEDVFARISFAEWCEALNVVRGEAVPDEQEVAA